MKKKFAKFVSSGLVKQSAWLLLFISLLITIGGLCRWMKIDHCCNLSGASCAFWQSFLYATDPGYMGQDMEANENFTVTGVIITLLGWIFLTGFTLAWVVNVYERFAMRIREGKIRYSFKGKHGIILGWNPMGISVVEQLLERGCKEIVIFSLREAPEIRRHLRGRLKNFNKRKKAIYILNGAFDLEEELRHVSPEKAREIVILGDPNILDSDEDHAVLGGTTIRSCDSRNIEVAMQLNDIFRSKGGTKDVVPCHIHLSNLRAYNLFQRTHLPQKNANGLDLRPFNYYENWAWQLWCPLENNPYPPLAHQAITREKENYVHLVIAGFGFMGQAVAAQAIQLAHYANGQKTKITIIDNHLDWWQDVFHSHYVTDNIPDIQMKYIDKSLESPEVRDYLVEAAQDPKQVLTIAISLSDPDAAMGAALSLPREILMPKIPILVRQETTSGLDRLSRLIKDTKEFGKKPEPESQLIWEDIHFFGQLDQCAQFNENRMKVAARIHDDYYKLVQKTGAKGKPAAISWGKLAAELQKSNLCQADMMATKVNLMGYHLVPSDEKRQMHQFSTEEIERLAEIEHDRWNAERFLAGWTYSKPRMDLHRKHDCLVPYDALTEEYKNFDRDPSKNLPGLLREYCGLDIVPAEDKPKADTLNNRSQA